ncbi:IBR domain-containing protein [Colletotrichum truncatum]|uniref:IBR domain-containing protein n=1 Tax=Colletotrichum truncatum TaxID=5467 RepID=A0ACC3Z3Q7_COLTU|nr:IBR domain-containing protein [Colletotrichum truncatum]KAF6795593.1 IBR domain-containing protein [Colletotrichum truncatum]
MSTSTATIVGMEAATSMHTRLEGYDGFYSDSFLTLQDFEVRKKPVNSSIKVKVDAVPEPPARSAPPVPPAGVSAPETNVTDASNDTTDDVDWEKYNPPAALTSAPNVTSEILLEVLQTSIDNIKARIAEDNKRRQLEEELRIREAEELASKEAEGKAKEPYLPIIVLPEEAEASACQSKENDDDIKLFPAFKNNGEGSSSPGLIVLPIRPKKRSRFALTRILQKMSEKEGVKPSSSRNLFRFGGDSSKTSIETPSDENKTSQSKQNHSPDVECVSCLDDFAPKETVKVVCHSYCHDCFERLIATACQNEQQWPPKCCLNDIPFRTILRYVSKDLGKTYKERSDEWKIPIGDRLYCSQPDCSLWIKPDQVNPGLRVARCTNGHWSCTICRGPQHDNSNCPQDRDMALTNALAEEEGWQHCSQCQALVEHREACQHMTCRCGHQFCYVCGRKWRSCSCTMDQLTAIKAGAATRREQRRQRELDAEADLRDALRQIEEFEREEALKAELLRQEMERQEEERRQRELEERVRLESLRRHEVEIKYQELRELLDQLHDLQEVMVRYQHDKEVEISAHEASTSTAELLAKQEAELVALEEKVTQKMAAKEQTLASEYGRRVLEEKNTEDTYLRQLESFFADKPSSEERINELMRNFRKRMDKGWRAWSKWRDDELARYSLKVEEERTIREEVMYSIKQRHEENVEESKKETTRRQAAELQWVTLVVAERARLLAEMETTELDDGAESFFSLSDEGDTTEETSAGAAAASSSSQEVTRES